MIHRRLKYNQLVFCIKIKFSGGLPADTCYNDYTAYKLYYVIYNRCLFI